MGDAQKAGTGTGAGSGFWDQDRDRDRDRRVPGVPGEPSSAAKTNCVPGMGIKTSGSNIAEAGGSGGGVDVGCGRGWVLFFFPCRNRSRKSKKSVPLSLLTGESAGSLKLH